LPLFETELFPESLTDELDDELPESFTLPPVAVAEPPAPPVAVTTLVFRFVLVLLPPVAVDEEPEVFVFVFLFLLLLVFELLFELLGSVGGFSH